MGLRRRVGEARIIAVLEPRSHTMRMGVHRDTLAPVARAAPTRCGCTRRPTWAGIRGAVMSTARRARATSAATSRRWCASSRATLRPGDHVLIMSNGGFGGLHGKLLAELDRDQ